jgi:hypothetical protein
VTVNFSDRFITHSKLDLRSYTIPAKIATQNCGTFPTAWFKVKDVG